MAEFIEIPWDSEPAGKAKVKEKKLPEPLGARPGFKFGADPEAFILGPDGKVVPAERFIPGSKSEPFKVELGAVQVDGFAAEFNIDPVDSYEEWERNFDTVIRQLRSYLPSDHRLSFQSAAHIPVDVFEAASETAKELGCSPDYNAWTRDVNPVPDTSHDPYLRTAAGHIHLGWTGDAELDDPQHILNCHDIVKQFDWYLGAWSLKLDRDSTRRSLYGKAGAHRIKPYGVEYRVLSNFWVDSKELRLAVWNRLQVAIADMRSNNLPEKKAMYNSTIRSAIDNSQYNPLMFRDLHYPLETYVR